MSKAPDIAVTKVDGPSVLFCLIGRTLYVTPAAFDKMQRTALANQSENGTEAALQSIGVSEETIEKLRHRPTEIIVVYGKLPL